MFDWKCKQRVKIHFLSWLQIFSNHHLKRKQRRGKLIDIVKDLFIVLINLIFKVIFLKSLRQKKKKKMVTFVCKSGKVVSLKRCLSCLVTNAVVSWTFSKKTLFQTNNFITWSHSNGIEWRDWNKWNMVPWNFAGLIKIIIVLVLFNLMLWLPSSFLHVFIWPFDFKLQRHESLKSYNSIFTMFYLNHHRRFTAVLDNVLLVHYIRHQQPPPIVSVSYSTIIVHRCT